MKRLRLSPHLLRLLLLCLALLACRADAGVMTQERLKQLYPSPYIVGTKDDVIPVWPLFRQNATENQLLGYVFESIDLAPIPGFAGMSMRVFRVIAQAGLDPALPLEITLLVRRAKGLMYPERIDREFHATLQLPPHFVIAPPANEHGLGATWKQRALTAGARRLSEATGGAFDITMQPLWQLAAAGRDAKPALPLIGWRALKADARRVALLPGMAITLNGIAQGYALDLARAALQAHDIQHALIDAGEFGSLGRAEGGEPWRLGVRDPRRIFRAITSLIRPPANRRRNWPRSRWRRRPASWPMACPPLSWSPAAGALALAAAMPSVDMLLVGKDGSLRHSAGMPHSA